MGSDAGPSDCGFDNLMRSLTKPEKLAHEVRQDSPDIHIITLGQKL